MVARSVQKLAKDLKPGDFVVAKNGVPCKVIKAKRFKDRKYTPHRQMVGIIYEATVGEETESFFAAFSLRFRVLCADV